MKNMVYVDTKSIRETEKQMINKANEILELLKELREKVEGSVEYFDTPTATYFREKMNIAIDNVTRNVNGRLKPCIDYLNIVSNKYDEAKEKTTESVIGDEERK